MSSTASPMPCRSQYIEGVADPERVNPDLWTVDQHSLDLPGRDHVMLDLLYDFTSNITLCPAWQEYLRRYRPPTLITWGENDRFFTPQGARAYLADVPDARLHLLDTGHCALATHVDEIAQLIVVFPRNGAVRPSLCAPSNAGTRSATERTHR